MLDKPFRLFVCLSSARKSLFESPENGKCTIKVSTKKTMRITTSVIDSGVIMVIDAHVSRAEKEEEGFRLLSCRFVTTSQIC